MPGAFLLNILLMNITCVADTAITARHSKNDHHLTRLFVEVTAVGTEAENRKRKLESQRRWDGADVYKMWLTYFEGDVREACGILVDGSRSCEPCAKY